MKRQPGGQQDNRNARKHGLYSGQLSPGELELYNKFVNQEHIEPPVAFLRIKLWNVIKSDPANRRALAEISNLLADWSAAFYRYDRDGRYTLKKFIDILIENLVQQELRASHLAENDKKLPERIEPVLPAGFDRTYSQLISNSGAC